ncbi:hypothetical protein [Streptomyces sp. NPDC048357]|uniref:hypothetical protein n=1 Tax=Streptomyces sp. NPDC048357 TaxID=3154719 RepID=UPI003413C078
MTSIHRLALLKAAIAVGAIRVAPSAIGSSRMPPSTGTLIPMRPESAGRTATGYGSGGVRAA